MSELWTYAYPVLLKALADDAGVSRARQLVGLPHVSDEAREAIMFTAYHRGDLAGDMLLKAIPRFLVRVVERRKWDSKKSSLATHFANACWCAYPEVLRVWLKERRELTDDIDRHAVKTVKAVDHVVPNQELIRMIVLKANHRVRPVLGLLWEGYSITEAAEKLHLKPSTVRSRLFEFRTKKLLPHVAQGRIIPPPGYALHSPWAGYDDIESGWGPDWSTLEDSA